MGHLTSVVSLPALPAAEPDRIAALEAQLGAQAELIAAINTRLIEVEGRLPKPRFILRGWLAPKQAQHELGRSRATVYRWCRSGKLVSAGTGHGLRIDPASVEKLKQ